MRRTPPWALLLFAAFSILFVGLSVMAAPLWSGNSQLSYLQTAGNTQVRTIGTGSEVNYQPKHWLGTFKGNYTNGTAGGVSVANALNLNLRGARIIEENTEVFLATSFLRNPFNSFNSRITGDIGATYAVIHSDEHKLRPSLAIGAVREDRTTGELNNFYSSTFGLKYNWKISETAELVNDFSFLYNLKNTRDWRFTNEVALVSTLTSIFSLKIGYQAIQLNLPAPGFRKLDTQSTVAVVAKY